MNRNMRGWILAIVLVLTTSCGKPTNSDLSPQRALTLAGSFRMLSTSENAHEHAVSHGLKKSSSRRVDDITVISYGGAAQVKLVFSNRNLLTSAMVRVQDYDKASVLRAANVLQQSLGAPKKVWGLWSDFLGGVNFETSVYAEWPGLLLSVWSSDDGIWIERGLDS